MIARLLAVLVWLLALTGAAAAHEITFSHIEVRLDPGQTRITARLPLKALAQNGATPQATAAHLAISADGRPLALSIRSIAPAGDDIAIEATAPPVFGALTVSADLFPGDGLHKVFVNVSRRGDLVGQYALDHQDPAFTLATPKRPLAEVIGAFIVQGVRHIAIGPDHILFVLALVLLGGRLASQAKIVTAFTLAHSLTLALATLGLVHLPPRLVESLIALSIVVVGLHDLRRLWRPSAETGRDLRAAYAFGFGLIHGFGFAGVLGQLDLPREALAWSLAAFNIGVEIGQLAIVLAAAPLLWALGRYAPPRIARGVLTGAAGVVVAAGLFWLVQRALGL